ncbi:hypothetical protein SAMN05660199_01291 [Klenkia soli]|uniref:(S)-ureidoglycine aminohydrolase cupin domain-containing protein n=1 Tax=Klenkia soli TaxID=1052260 RepID=A0A1H0GMV6_9ACTN|nr:cupin domain-containing protein [Klenkia soli]SDO08224.1 hypothetical protein SAMN05660199_01291 [Klenkia soli]
MTDASDAPRTTADARLLSPAAAAEPLEELPLAEGTVLAGAPRAGHRTLLDDGTAVGVWELTTGTVTDVEVDEVFVVLAGAGSVTFADGSAVLLAPGVVVRLRAGDATTWVVTETVRKVYVA